MGRRRFYVSPKMKSLKENRILPKCPPIFPISQMPSTSPISRDALHFSIFPQMPLYFSISPQMPLSNTPTPPRISSHVTRARVFIPSFLSLLSLAFANCYCYIGIPMNGTCTFIPSFSPVHCLSVVIGN